MSKKCISLLLILLVSLLFCTQRVQGQTVTNDQKKTMFFSLYGEGGWSLSSFHSSNESIDPKFSSTSSVALGGGINMRFLESKSHYRFAEDGLLAFQAGILYTKSGFEADDEKITGDYICVPISFQYYPISDLYVELGMEMCMNIGLSPSSAVIQGLNIDLDNHKANDFKIGIGAGYIHEFENIGPIGISAKYLIGTSEFAENLPWKGNQLRISVFYRFGL